MKITVDNIVTLYYDAPSNASREEEEDEGGKKLRKYLSKFTIL